MASHFKVFFFFYYNFPIDLKCGVFKATTDNIAMIRKQLALYSLGFGYMSFLSDMSEQDMPHLHRQHEDWIPREFDRENLEIFDKKIRGRAGLEPRNLDNYITIAVDPEVVVWQSLTDDTRRLGRVQWYDSFAGMEGLAFLVDGNHRARYTEEFILNKLLELRKSALDTRSYLSGRRNRGTMVEGLTKVIEQLETTLRSNSKWIVQLFDASMFRVF